MMSLKLIKKTDKLPVNMDELKLFLRISNDEEDKLITQMINAVVPCIEFFLDKKLIYQVWRMEINAEYAFSLARSGKPIKIPYKPLIKIKEDPKLTQPDRSIEYHFDSQSKGIILDGYINYDPRENIQIDFACGYGKDHKQIPDEIKQAIYIMVASLYEHRLSNPSQSMDFPIMEKRVRDILTPLIDDEDRLTSAGVRVV